MCSKQTPEESNIEEGEIIADPVAILEEETVHYNEPSVNYSYYKPSLDSHSEFPWHHPENQAESLEIDMPEIDMSKIHNPWDIYGGNIPANKEVFDQNEKNTVDFQEIRKYAWDYIQPHNNQYQTDSHYYEQQHYYSTELNLQDNNDNHHCEHKDGVWPSEYQSNPNITHTNVHLDASHNDDYHHQQHNEHRFYEQKSQQGTQDHHHNVQQYHYENTPIVHHSYYEQHVQEHKCAEPQQTHETHYNNFKETEENNNTSNQQHNNESQIENHVCHIHNYHEEEHQLSKKFNSFTPSLFKKHNRPQIYTVMMDHIKLNHYVVPEEKINGYASDDESDFEDITPRHPYDGFYLRHRMTIDSRGRKICTHEIPLRPPSPPSESSEEFEDAMETFAEEITNKAINEEDSQTGVAGNLARVVPGEPLQQEAVDELTRRQGWEAGNIDYMGADSFDNIWAKISQTLSTPPSSEQQEPAKETAPEAVADPPSEPAPLEAAKEPEPVPVAPASETTPTSESVPVEAPSEKAEKSVEAPKEQKVEETPSEVAPVEVPKPVESIPVEESPEAAAPLEEAPAVVQPTPVEVPVPVEGPAATTESIEAAGKPEEIIPVPVEAAAVELLAPVESATEVKEKTKPESADIPVVALEALKIGETAVAEVAATIESAAPILESTPTKELKPTEAAKPDVASDSPPLAHTPSKEEIPVAPAAKSEERRKPAGKLQLRPPLTPDPALTPDSEAEDAAALAHAIISSELRTPTVTAPTPPTLSPADQPSVSLSQIGVKSKPTTAARIESSVKTDSAPSTPESPKPAEAPKKKIIKKVVKKKEEGATSGEAPVPPPRKKEKKPKET